MICQNCQFANDDRATTCSFCGNSLKVSWWRRLFDGMKGAKIDSVGETAPPSLTELERIAQVATEAVKDELIGEMVAEALMKVGRDGHITVEELGVGTDSDEVEHQPGMLLHSGYISPEFVTNAETMEALIEAPYIVIAESVISLAESIRPALGEILASGRKNVVVIAAGVSTQALAMLLEHKRQHGLICLAVKVPDPGYIRKTTLEDIAVLTGGTVFGNDFGRNLERSVVEDFGQARLISATAKETIILDGGGSKEAIQARVDQINAQIDMARSEFDRHKLQERLGNLTSGRLVIRVGSKSALDLATRKGRMHTALEAARTALHDESRP